MNSGLIRPGPARGATLSLVTNETCQFASFLSVIVSRI